MGKKILLDHSRIGPWVAQKLGADWVPEATATVGLVDIAEDGSERIVAGAMFSDYNKASIQIHIAGEPGSRWLTRAFLGFCFKYAFNQAGVGKLLSFIGSKNEASFRFCAHLGFRLEARIESAHPDGALLIYSMTPDQCRWLGLDTPKGALYGQE
jgi:RimJ/RimL family protein N-acetyltransferase